MKQGKITFEGMSFYLPDGSHSFVKHHPKVKQDRAYTTIAKILHYNAVQAPAKPTNTQHPCTP